MILRLKGLRLAVLFLAAGVAAGISLGLFLTRDVPEVDSLQFTTPRLMTRIYSRDAQVIQRYGAEKRTLVQYGDISPNFLHALLAIEDADFYHHHGLSFRGILRALVSNVTHRRASQGGSTLTQQLARQYFLTPEKTISRKIKEAILAVNIERHYSKDQILELYANKVCFGHAFYGVESSSRFYFGKRARDLSIPEAALLAGLIQRPSYYSPVNYPDRAMARRNVVLQRMWKTGYITEAQYKEFSKGPISLAKGTLEENSLAPYVSERVRMYCEEKYGEEVLDEQGLQVYTTIDPKLQALAAEAVKEGLHEYSHRHGYKGSRRGEDSPTEYTGEGFQKGERYWATVRSTASNGVTIAMGSFQATLEPKSWQWAGRLDPVGTFREGDRILLFVKETKPALQFELDQEPIAQAALVAMDPHSGEVLALVGGYDFSTSMFNRAIQAKRQTGSAVKPIIYATAIQNGLTFSDTVIDEPTLFLTGRERAAQLCAEGYIPHDFDPDYFGYITYQTALEHSVNIAAVHLLNRTGFSRVINTARQLHITTDLQPYPSMALGAFEITLWELTGAYAALDNSGVWMEPRFLQRIADSDGKTLEEFRPVSQPVFDTKTAFIMVQGMTGVIKRGTAGSAADMKGHFAGKTGTTDAYTDSWFLGFNPALVCGVWAGRDDHKPLGHLETGARVGLPIWRKFMEPATAGQENLDWTAPVGIVRVMVDPRTGLRAGVDSPCPEVREQYFLEGNEPKAFCTPKDHFRLKLPYFLQAYSIGPDDRLSIPQSDLETFVRLYPGTVSQEGPSKLLVTWNGSTFPVSLEVSPARSGPVALAVMPDLPHEGDIACGARTEYVQEKQ